MANIQSKKMNHHPRRERRTPLRNRVNAILDSSDEESSDKYRYFKWDRKGNRHSPSPLKGSPKPQSSHDEPQTDPMDRLEVSIFDGKNLVMDEFRVVIVNIWNKLRRRLGETPVEHISSLRKSFDSAFANLQNLDIDFSPLKVRVEEAFKKAHKFDELRFTIFEKISSESQGMSLSTAKDELKNAQDKVARLKKDLLEQHQAFKAAKDKEAKLERELELTYDLFPMGRTVGLLLGEVGGDGTLLGDADIVRSESLFWLDCGKVFDGGLEFWTSFAGFGG
nr:uncharacterized protein LOC109157601 [Ipomoea batatas]